MAYQISDSCVACGACEAQCPVGAISMGDGKFEIEGEAIITYPDFEKINSKLSDDEKYKNPRNLASGSVRQLDSSIAKDRHVRFIAWKLPFGVTHFSIGFEIAEKYGFEVVPYKKYNSKKDDINEVIEELKRIAEEKGFPIDGLVITYDNVEYGKSLGTTGHHPRHSLAFKFYDETYEPITTVNGVDYKVIPEYKNDEGLIFLPNRGTYNFRIKNK